MKMSNTLLNINSLWIISSEKSNLCGLINCSIYSNKWWRSTIRIPLDERTLQHVYTEIVLFTFQISSYDWIEMNKKHVKDLLLQVSRFAIRDRLNLFLSARGMRCSICHVEVTNMIGDRWMSTDSRKHSGGIVERPGEFPLLSCLVGLRLQHHRFHDLEVVLGNVVFTNNHSLNGWNVKININFLVENGIVVQGNRGWAMEESTTISKGDHGHGGRQMAKNLFGFV